MFTPVTKNITKMKTKTNKQICQMLMWQLCKTTFIYLLTNITS